MYRSGGGPAHRNTSRSSTQTTASCVAATVAERGHEYMSDTSPKQSPRILRFTRMFTPAARIRSLVFDAAGAWRCWV